MAAAVRACSPTRSITGFGIIVAIAYNDFELLTLDLGGNTDTLHIDGTHDTRTKINGADGADTFNIEAISGNTTIFGDSVGTDPSATDLRRHVQRQLVNEFGIQPTQRHRRRTHAARAAAAATPTTSVSLVGRRVINVLDESAGDPSASTRSPSWHQSPTSTSWSGPTSIARLA